MYIIQAALSGLLDEKQHCIAVVMSSDANHGISKQ